jgi:type IV secretion system protein VirB11
VFTLSDYVAHGIMTEIDRAILARAIRERENILVVGGTRSGKTTLTNALIDEMVAATPDHRIVIIEDTAEIQCSAENALLLHTAENVGMRELLRLTLRSRPDRILVGEVRGGEALSLLKAWNTGHPGGVATVHANNAVAGLVRLEQLIGEVSASPSSALIGEAVDVVVAIEMGREGRVVREIIEVMGYRNGQYETRVLSRRKENAREVGQAVAGVGDGGNRFVRAAGR